jgi:hypothetical protein
MPLKNHLKTTGDKLSIMDRSEDNRQQIASNKKGHMSILSPRVHVVGIRFSLEEYDTIHEFCIKKRVHTIAELARQAINAYMAESNKKDALEEVTIKQTKYVKRLEEKLSALGAEMEALKANQAASTT